MTEKIVREKGLAKALEKWLGASVTPREAEEWLMGLHYWSERSEVAKVIRAKIGEKKFEALDKRGNATTYVLKQLNVKISDAWLNEWGY